MRALSAARGGMGGGALPLLLPCDELRSPLLLSPVGLIIAFLPPFCCPILYLCAQVDESEKDRVLE